MSLRIRLGLALTASKRLIAITPQIPEDGFDILLTQNGDAIITQNNIFIVRQTIYYELLTQDNFNIVTQDERIIQAGL